MVFPKTLSHDLGSRRRKIVPKQSRQGERVSFASRTPRVLYSNFKKLSTDLRSVYSAHARKRHELRRQALLLFSMHASSTLPFSSTLLYFFFRVSLFITDSSCAHIHHRKMRIELSSLSRRARMKRKRMSKEWESRRRHLRALKSLDSRSRQTETASDQRPFGWCEQVLD